MTVKDRFIQMMNELPNEVSWDDIENEYYRRKSEGYFADVLLTRERLFEQNDRPQAEFANEAPDQ